VNDEDHTGKHGTEIAGHGSPIMKSKITTLELVAVIFCFLGALRVFAFMPFILSSWADIYQLNESQMGLIASLDLAVASTVVFFTGIWLKYVRSLSVLLISMVSFLVLDFLSFTQGSFAILIILRVLSGIFTGVSIAVITIHLARARDPGQAFGLSIFVQWAIPGVTYIFIPRLLETYGTMVMFDVMAVNVLLGLLSLPLVSRAPLIEPVAETRQGDTRLPLFVPIVVLVMNFIFYAVVSGYWAFAERLASIRDLLPANAGNALAIASFGAAGSALMVSLFERFVGRARTIVLFLGFLIACLAWMVLEGGYAPYLAGTMAIALAWGIVPPMLFAILVDNTDRPGLIAASPGLQGYGASVGPLMLGPLLASGMTDFAIETLAGMTVLQIGLLAGIRRRFVVASRDGSEYA